ncbi:hypothetical protein NOK12_20970 [Nocardioides sp. OK12]|uniref:alternate-type signal peptide domain-containing protein n=1 Tax=Nocardioides sp. OK12 TaxID=2758661 RepID=UPI0021C2885C|nr:alternate-type signal peptide domain-containing protein [Nocardioides sp. OK12]GHJ59579.1 hypothetical protein NOK12_20970 [Nocardioides sp. OK12]
MRTSLKAALAGVAGAGLLLGGAGSLAFWDDEETVDGGTIEAGTLNLLDAECTGWTTGAAADTPFDVGYLIVPGDSFERSCDFTLRVEGDVTASLSVNDQAVDGGVLGSELDVKTEYAVFDGLTDLEQTITEATDWPFTEADSGKTLRATITVELPWDGNPDVANDQVNNASNSLQGDQSGDPLADNKALTAVLDELTVTVTQTS